MSLPHHDSVKNLNIVDEIPLFSPAYITRQLPLSPETEKFVSESRKSAVSILNGEDDRLLVVVGPCSIHNKKSAEQYGELIRQAREKHNEDLEIIMRTYFEKPRTTTGWEGFTADPHLDGSYDMNHGLFQARKLLLHLAARGIPAATEFVSVTSPQYFADLITYGAIGARTVESQPHRKLTSGLSMPTGMKNATNGGIKVAVDGILSAHHPHFFDSITEHGTYALFRSKGNTGAHLILRGGDTGTNYDEKSIQEAMTVLQKAELPEYAVIDESHGNSNKKYENQPQVNADISKQIAGGSKFIRGVMIEGHIKEGAQKMSGQIDPEISITDSCVSWETTERMLAELAAAVQERRSK